MQSAARFDLASPITASSFGSKDLSALTDAPASFSQRLALVDDDRQWTYGEVHAEANRIAHWLVARGVAPGDVVAIHAERSALTVVALLAAIKAGAAFTLLDAEHPSARLVEQARAAQPAAWIHALRGGPMLAEASSVVPDPERRLDVGGDVGAAAGGRPPVAIDLDRRGYVAFTSGTKGGPKGIVGSLRPLSHFLAWHAATFGFGQDDRFSALSGVGHDPFLRDVLTPLSIGASVHMPDQALRLEPDRLVAWMAEQGITVAHLTPSLGEVLALARGGSLPKLRAVFFGGEALRGELVQSLRPLMPNARIVNFYGTTETPQAMAWFDASAATAARAPVGQGIDGVQLLVLRDDGAVAGAGEEGEVVVRTPYLALGYLDGRPGGFATNPARDDRDDRVYRTGDRGRVLPSGDVEIVGRRDDQVKVRGFRVELADVEEAARACGGVQRSAVALDEKRRSLVAYVVMDPGKDPGSVLAALRDALPDYMVPGHVVPVAAIPLTANGKIDRRALLELAPRASVPPPSAGGDDDLASDAERKVAEIWRSVLGADDIRRHDNFFDVGGHSLNATQVASKLRDVFGVEVAVRTVFEAPTVAELAARVSASAQAPAQPKDRAQRGRGQQQKRRDGKEKPRQSRIQKANVPGGSVTSFWQDAVLAWERRRAPTSSWNFPVTVRLEGPLDRDALVEAITHVLERQESLRQILSRDPADPPRLCTVADIPIPFIDMTGVSKEDFEAQTMSEMNAPFPLDGSPLVRFRVVRHAPENHTLHLCWHQLVSDAIPKLLLDEIFEGYASRVEKRPARLPRLPVRYVDFAVSERAWVGGEGSAEVARARARLEGARPCELPLDRPRGGPCSTVPLTAKFWVEADEVERFAQVCKGASGSLFMGLTALAGLTVHRLGGGDDIPMITPYGAPVDAPELQSLIGRFGNWLPVRVSLAEDPTFGALVERVRADLLDGFSLARAPASVVYDTADPFESDLARVALNMPDIGEPPPARQVAGLTISIEGGVPRTACRTELTLILIRGGGRLRIEVMGSASLFEQSTVDRAGEIFRSLLRSARPDARISELS